MFYLDEGLNSRRMSGSVHLASIICTEKHSRTSLANQCLYWSRRLFISSSPFHVPVAVWWCTFHFANAPVLDHTHPKFSGYCAFTFTFAATPRICPAPWTRNHGFLALFTTGVYKLNLTKLPALTVAATTRLTVTTHPLGPASPS